MATTPYDLAWPVDQAGYELEYDEGEPWIRARGGLPTYKSPMKIEGLWRRFANQCCDVVVDAKGDRVPIANCEGILAFVNEFGLLAAKRSPDLLDLTGALRNGLAEAVESQLLQDIFGVASLIGDIADHCDNNRRPAAAEEFNNPFVYPNLTARIESSETAGKLELKLVPIDLCGALLLQAAETITGNLEWRHCRNERCSEWFRIGSLDNNKRRITKRREFCSSRCKVADAERRRKTQEVQQ